MITLKFLIFFFSNIVKVFTVRKTSPTIQNLYTYYIRFFFITWSLRSRQSKLLSRISSQAQKGLSGQAMPVVPPPPSVSNALSRDGGTVVAPTTRAKNVVCLVKANNANARVNRVVSQAKAKNEESFDKAKSSREKGIFEISDTETVIIDNIKIGGFLEACSLCKRKLGRTSNLYMYGDLGAFCSLSCRQRKMVIDSFEKEFFREFPHFRAPRTTTTRSKLLRVWHKVFG